MRTGLVVALAAVAIATPATAANLTISQYGRIAGTLPWAVALEKGMFKAAGLDIDGITAGSGGGTTMRNTLAGEIPVGEVSTSVAIAAARSGVKLKVIYAASNHVGELAWAAKPDSGINSIKDLIGKKVAYTNPRSTTEMVVRYALEKENLTDKVEILPLGGLGPALTALSQSAVAAAPLNDPLMTLHPGDYRILFYAWKYYPQFCWQVGVTTDEYAAAHPDIVRKIVEVHRKAVDFTYANKKEAAEIYAKDWNVQLPEAIAILPKYYEWHHWSAGEFSREGLDAVINGLNSVGELQGSVDWSKLIDQQYLDKDLHQKL